ncbi:MAG: hypothetical protein RUMPE_00488 [Eubacteriales bacterium SKADARSKE-1]|nr:hypothetical protein [Eubacteriales bacterium SKADARSKE-1]
MMRTINKVISVILISTMLVSTCSITTFAWNWPWEEVAKVDICELKNGTGGYEDFDCVNSKGKKTVRDGSAYIFFDKIGYNSDQELHIFDFSKASEVINNLKPLPNELSWQERNKIDDAKINFWAKVTGSTSAAVSSFLVYFYNTKIKDLINLELEKKRAEGLKVTDEDIDVGYRLLSIWESIGIIGAASLVCTTLAKVFVGFYFASEHSKESSTKKINISNYVSVLEQISNCLEKDCWKNRDSISIRFNKDSNNYFTFVNFLNLGRNYTDSEKEYYISELKTNVESLLKTYEEGK